MTTSDDTARRMQLMQTASDELEAAINHLEEAGSLDEIILILRTAENNLEDEVIRLEDQAAE